MINSFLNKHNISKRKIFLYYTEFWQYKNRGAELTSNYISALTSLGLWGMIFKVIFNLEISMLGKWLIGFMLLNFLMDYTIGKWYQKSGLWEYQANYSSKKQHISPNTVETNKTLKSIAEKVGGKSYFTEL